MALAIKACPICAEPVRQAACKCIHCSSDLDWRRYLGLSGTTLAALTALVAVVAAVAPTIKATFEPRDASLHFTFMGAGSARTLNQDGHLTEGDTVLLASNDGTQPGAFVGSGVIVSWTTAGRRLGLVAQLETPGDEPIIISPGTAVAARLLNNPDLDLDTGTTAADARALVAPRNSADPLTAPIDDARCEIGVTVVSAAGLTKDLRIPARCPTLHPFLVRAITMLGR